MSDIRQFESPRAREVTAPMVYSDIAVAGAVRLVIEASGESVIDAELRLVRHGLDLAARWVPESVVTAALDEVKLELR